MRLGIAATFAACLVTLAIDVPSAMASHFFGASMSWENDLAYDPGGTGPDERIVVTFESAWRWSFPWPTGAELLHEELGDPGASTNYALCVYDSIGSAPACRLPSRWRRGRAGPTRRPRAGCSRTRAVPRGGRPNPQSRPRSPRQVERDAQGQGRERSRPAAIGETYFHQEPLLTVQLVSSGGDCWTSEFDVLANRKSTTERFRAMAKGQRRGVLRRPADHTATRWPDGRRADWAAGWMGDSLRRPRDCPYPNPH